MMVSSEEKDRDEKRQNKTHPSIYKYSDLKQLKFVTFIWREVTSSKP